MIAQRYNPFSKPLEEFDPAELVALRDVSEGWFVDYKSEPLSPKDFGKHLSAFANQFGGWLFVGVAEGPNKSLKAGSFPGIPNDEVGSVMVRIREGSSAHVSPAVYFNHRIIEGPVPSIQLEAGKSVIVIAIPEGSNPPFVHSSGKIYRRIADSSEPKAETDRAVLDMMWRKSEDQRTRLREFILKPTQESTSENAFCYVYLMEDLTLSQPEYNLNLRGFRDAMGVQRDGYPSFPLDNIYSTQNGFIARHLSINHPAWDLHSLRWWRSGNVCLTIPINFIRTHPNQHIEDRLLMEFVQAMGSHGLGYKILNLDEWMFTLFTLAGRYLDLRNILRSKDAVFGKILFSNARSAAPFIGMESYLKTLAENGVPVVQDSVTMFPPGVQPNVFVTLPDDSGQEHFMRQINLIMPLLLNGLSCLGVNFDFGDVGEPSQVFAKEFAVAMDRAVKKPPRR